MSRDGRQVTRLRVLRLVELGRAAIIDSDPLSGFLGLVAGGVTLGEVNGYNTARLETMLLATNYRNRSPAGKFFQTKWYADYM